MGYILRLILNVALILLLATTLYVLSPLSTPMTDEGRYALSLSQPGLVKGISSVTIGKPLSFSLFSIIQEMKGYTLDGYYNYMAKAIVISPDQFTFPAWWHEVGHHVWFFRMDDMQRQEFKKIHDSGHGIVDSYAETSVSEGFAEDFSWYCVRRQLDGVTHAFMQSLVVNLTGGTSCGKSDIS